MSQLTAEQIETFDEEGFVIVSGVFSSAEVSEMRRAFESLVEKAGKLGETGMYEGSQFVLDKTEQGEVRIKRIVWCGGTETRLSEIGRDPRLIEPASQLLGSSTMEQLINQAHFKFPGDGVAFPWHQDSVHRRYGTDKWDDINGKGSFVQTATAIDPMTDENGPLKFIRGSHRHGHIEPDPETKELPEKLIEEDQVVVAKMEPGDVAFFGPFVIHGSDPNRTETPRRLFINGYAYPGANHRDYPGDEAGRRLEVELAESAI